MDERTYEGTELLLFAQAHNWESYLCARISPHLSGRVLEVGAGMGTRTHALCNTSGISEWSAMEPDPELLAAIAHSGLPGHCKTLAGTLADLGEDAQFDTIVYLDVLEHIEDDKAELIRAAEHLAQGGRLVVLAPAHQALFSPFDAAIGHFRRYNRQSLLAAAPETLKPVRSEYLDCAGLLASAANRLLLKSAHPSQRQIAFWDGALVPISRIVDPLFARRLGKSLICVWRKR